MLSMRCRGRASSAIRRTGHPRGDPVTSPAPSKCKPSQTSCLQARAYVYLISMTRIKKTPSTEPPKGRRRSRDLPPGHWLLQDAKARFSELVRRVRSEGRQHVTVHGRDEVVIVSAEEFRRLKGERSGDALIAAMQAAPYREIDIEPERDRTPVRGVDL